MHVCSHKPVYVHSHNVWGTLSNWVSDSKKSPEAFLKLKLQFTFNYGSTGFPGASAVKNLPAMQGLQEMPVQLLGREDPLEKGMATHSSILAWRIPWTRGAWWVTVHRVAKSQT